MPYTRNMCSKPSSKKQQLEALFIPYLLANVLSGVITEPSQVEYQQLQRLVKTLKLHMDELLHKLRSKDRQPIRQELTFATQDIWNYKFWWPSTPMMQSNKHVGIVDSRHMYFLARKLCQESIIPLLHVTSQTEIPDYHHISPAAKTGLVFMVEHILKLIQYFSFKGNIL